MTWSWQREWPDPDELNSGPLEEDQKQQRQHEAAAVVRRSSAGPLAGEPQLALLAGQLEQDAKPEQPRGSQPVAGQVAPPPS